MQSFFMRTNEDSDQNTQMRRLIRVFVGRTAEGTFPRIAAHLSTLGSCPLLDWRDDLNLRVLHILEDAYSGDGGAGQ